jgi:hypothetical protein
VRCSFGTTASFPSTVTIASLALVAVLKDRINTFPAPHAGRTYSHAQRGTCQKEGKAQHKQELTERRTAMLTELTPSDDDASTRKAPT